ncbi:LysR family transcriptional regulator [Paraferrimonas haliotis]|uniref:LysR family transcriptional regulator n=1 Tax=Paraferrimonas haliotis TaxID=2013866 RepID=A0AA37TPX5_9GAMM|nr:LysR family transcriptional regulator [Paraferrimonas haliotis]GLS83265.1 LysR family transcriptional regulator [Paraferrimonas haliotis]
MAYSLEQLRAFVETANSGSFRGAALTIGKHSSTIGELVANLEIDIGVELFERSRRSISLTEAGKELLEFAKPVLREAEFFQDKADSVIAKAPTDFTVAIDPALRCNDVIDCYKSVLKRFPSINLTVLTGDVMQIHSWLRSGRVDVGFCPTGIQTPMDMSMSRSFAFELTNVVSTDYKVIDGSLTRQQLRSMPQIIHSFMKDVGLESAHRESHRVIVANNTIEIMEMVKSGLGWARLPVFLANQSSHKDELQMFKIDDGRTELWWGEVVYLSSRRPDAAMQLFIDKAKAIPDKL